ncbi:MAG TPA: hypothetical protein VEF06_12345 [Bryobacteraceae bacterium]|nr:hypothetical protein [Bryobacteraceae bacterium]
MRFLSAFAISLILLVLVLFAAVTATDPSRYFFGSPVPQIWPNNLRVKVEFFRKFAADGKVTGLLLGSSRCGILEPEQADRMTGLRFFNACVYDASTDSMLALYRFFRRPAGPPEMIVVGIDTFLLRAGAEPSQDLKGNYELSRQLEPGLLPLWHYARLYPHYLRFQTFTDLGTSLRNWASPKPPIDRFRPDGSLMASVESPARGPAGISPPEIEKLMVQYRAEFQSLSPGRLDRLRSLLSEASADGARIVLWITPVHPALRAAIDRVPSLASAEREARRAIAQLAVLYRARLFDLSGPDSYGGDPAGWVDPVHPGLPDARKELGLLLGQAQN